MTLTDMHPEDIKAALRKRFGTIRNFEIEHGLTKGSVGEILRKRRWAKVERAVESAIFSSENQSGKPDSRASHAAHRLNAKAA